jgi:hypothetical protein
LLAAAIATIWLGVVPGRVLDHANMAALDLQAKARAANVETQKPAPALQQSAVTTPAK